MSSLSGPHEVCGFEFARLPKDSLDLSFAASQGMPKEEPRSQGERSQGARELEAECPQKFEEEARKSSSNSPPAGRQKVRRTFVQKFFELLSTQHPGEPESSKKKPAEVLRTPVAPAAGGARKFEAECPQKFFQLPGARPDN